MHVLKVLNVLGCLERVRGGGQRGLGGKLGRVIRRLEKVKGEG